MLSTVSDFRWFKNCSDSPWYPTMRLFRQQQYGDWDTVVQKIAQKLQEHIKQTVSNLT